MAEHDTPTAESGAHSDATGFAHVSVMRDEIVEVLSEVPDGIVVDATLGGAGHAAALLAANDGISILGLDRDEMALAAASARLAAHGDRVTVRHTRFDGLAAAVQSLGAERLSGALFDLGVSSPQLDLADRGFSFRNDGPLDMRMDRSQGRTAADLVNTTDERTLAGILQRNGDERHARRIARAIIAARPISTTGELAEIVRDAFPPQLAATPDIRPARPFRRSASKSTTSSPCSKVRSPRLWICSPRKAGARC